jgi:hypothetical protein
MLDGPNPDGYRKYAIGPYADDKIEQALLEDIEDATNENLALINSILQNSTPLSTEEAKSARALVAGLAKERSEEYHDERYAAYLRGEYPMGQPLVDDELIQS